MRSVGRERGGGVPRVRDDAQPRDASRSRDDRRRGRDEEEEMNGSRGERRKEPSYMDDRERERHGRRELDRRRRDYSDEDEDRERRYRRDDRSHRRERSGRDEDRRRHHESSNETRRIRRDDATNEGSRSGLGTKDVGRSSAKPANGRCANGHGRPASSPPPSALSPPQEDPPPPPTPLPPPPPALSKMDKYFTHEYDPRLDLGEVPKEGFVGEVGWDNMLAILKERGKKRRHHSPTLSDDPLDIPAASAIRATSPPARRLEKPRKERKRRTWSDESEDEREREKRKEKRRAEKQREKALTTTMTTEGAADGKGMFDMAYVKKGGVREWDVGK